MPIRETSRVVTISGRRWKIGKFDALTGSYIALKMLSKLANIAVGVLSGELEDPAIIGMGIAHEISALTKAEIMEIQSECLLVISELQEVGGKEMENPVRLNDGRWGVGELENNAVLVMGLVGHVLLFNLTGFFDESTLKGLKESFTGLLPSKVSTSTGTPSPQ